MKKFLAMLMVAALCAGVLAGCGGGDDTSKAPAESAPAAQTQTQPETGTAGDASTEADTAAVAEAILSTLTIGYAGASQAGEELYLALDENIDYGIIGIVDNGKATFLFGGITEDANGLTITDLASGDSLTFTVSEPQQDDNGVYVEADFSGVYGVLYACDGQAVVAAMNQY